jgi:hypothetical protein
MNSRLLAIKLTGRSAAAAVYYDRELHYIEVRKLAPSLAQAKDSLVAFVSSLIEHFRIDSTVSEESVADTRAKALTAAMLDQLRELIIPHWSVKKSELFAVYGEIPLKSSRELRETVCNYWPHLIDGQSDRTCLDAAALGLHIQTDRMLSNHYPALP